MATKKTAKKPAKKTTKKKTTKKASSKKAPPKASAKATRTKKRRGNAASAGITRAQRKRVLDDIIATTNKAIGYDAVNYADALDSSFLLRRPTGIISLDIALAGGWPAGAPVVICGEDGSGKDYLLWKTAAESQLIYGEDFTMVVYLTEFRTDKLFMKDKCGLQIALTDQEIHEMQDAREEAGLPPLTEEDVAHYKHQVGNIIIIQGVTAESGFDSILDFVSSNTCHIVAINSIGSLQTEAKEKTEDLSDFAQQASEAMLMSKFMPQLSLLLQQTLEDGGSNETSVILINQMRSDRNAKTKKKGARSSGPSTRPALQSWSLNHHKAIELQLDKGSSLYDEVLKVYLGRTIRWKTNKGKLGTHDGLRGSYDFYFYDGVAILEDLISTCLYYEVLQQNGSWISFEDEEFGFKSVQGRHKVHKLLKASRGMQDAMRRECLRAAELVYRYK